MMKQLKYVQNRKNLREMAYTQLKNDIYSNKVKPGDYLSESLIAKELNMSRTPVREALRMLASEDLVEVRDGVGIYVKTISFKDITDIFEVRKALETLALKTSIHRITDEEIEELEKKFMDLMADYKKGINVPSENFAVVDWSLDELIIKKSNNNYIVSIINEVNFKIRRYQYLSFMAYYDVTEATSQHLKILSLMKERNIKDLIEANEKHIDWSLNCFLYSYKSIIQNNDGL